MAIDLDLFQSVFNHLAFPPKLPGYEDNNIQGVEIDLLNRIRIAVQTLKSCAQDEATAIWEGLGQSLDDCRIINEDRFVNKGPLKSALENIKVHNIIIVHVTQQNAALLIRSMGNDFIFEAFEASPSAEQTLEAKGAMQWDFPTIAVSLPREEFENPVFQENVVNFLNQASLETLEEFAAKSHKAGVSVVEIRDTAHPGLITVFLMTLLEINGSCLKPPALRKRVKDDVCWNNSELPWRRSPFWLILRVSVQRFLYLKYGEEEGRPQYKFLITTLLSQLLKDCVQTAFDAELTDFLKAKLCRRLAKLETEMKASGQSGLSAYKYLFEHIGPIYRDAIEQSTSFIENQWTAFKSRSIRKIPRLPRHANHRDVFLTLPNSGDYLRGVWKQYYYPVAANPPTVDLSILDSNSSKATTQYYNSLLEQYCKLEDLETNIELATSESQNCQEQCQKMAKKICGYMEAVGHAYDGNTEQMSIFILNVFELWVSMDKCAVNTYPLLSQYHPLFKPEMLDVLLLSRYNDLKRLQSIQEYIYSRCEGAERSMDIFVDPQEGCFANQFFLLGNSSDISNLNRLRDDIAFASQRAAEAKEKELHQVNAEYEQRTQKMMQLDCTQRRNLDGSHDIHGCTYCWHMRRRKRLRIKVHEEFLPNEKEVMNIVQKRAILFELDTPLEFASYRGATWEIVNFLCPQIESSGIRKPKMILKDYTQLAKYYHRNKSNFSLASTTKSFLGTHYNFRHLPAEPRTILLPLGLTFSYYDSSRDIWAADTQRPFSFAHHFAIKLPEDLPFSNLYGSAEFAADCNGPSSYDAIASISECPSDLSLHEYTAHQSLNGGRQRRWFSILTELGSSNVNFSLQDTMILFQHLSLQAGPRLENDDLRVVHVILKEYGFCKELLSQIDSHVEAISENWREHYYMETLLTLTLRVRNMGHFATVIEANKLLLKIRSITLTWIRTLRDETRTTSELDIAERSARYGFLAALLCRRTFFLVAYDNTNIDQHSLMVFIEATLTMQENLVVDLSRFSTITSNMLIRDIKMAHRLRSKIRRAAHQHSSSLEAAIEKFWPNSTDIPRSYSSWQSIEAPYEWWITATIEASKHTKPQVVHYHLLEGHLLIDGKALGKLPATIRDSTILKELFGNQQLVSFPSNIAGMSYQLGIPQNGYYIHLGYRGQDLVIQASRGKTRQELIPSNVFGDDSNFDIPGSLIRDCVHWLDLETGSLEARRKPKIWHSTPGNWIISLQNVQAKRKQSVLVDPKSNTFQLVSDVFRDFAPAHALTVYQPLRALSVEIKSMDLTFEVNKEGRLLSRQLRSEIDPDQDAGSLYGLKSMIVLRDAKNPTQRSVLATLGNLKYRRLGTHVESLMENDGRYAVYFIDSILGRLHCPPVPLLLYSKAQMHAYTSFVIPDPLTGRTGTEEALRCLRSGSSQPWNPLSGFSAALKNIASLSPKRHYYPEILKRQQQVSWDPNLTITIQNDSYQELVDSILTKSQRLNLFSTVAQESVNEDHEPGPKHLRERAYWHRSIYERPSSNAPSLVEDFVYIVRGKKIQSKSVKNSREIITLLRRKPTSICTTHSLKEIMKEWQIIGSYTSEFVSYSIHDCLGADLAQAWGGLVNSCRKESQDAYNVMFILGLMAFSTNVDMRILRTLAAFFILDDLRRVPLPECQSLSGLDIDQQPSFDELANTIRSFCNKFEEPKLPHKKKAREQAFRKRDEDIRLHEERCLQDSTDFATFLLRQWPNRKPSVKGYEGSSFDQDAAINGISYRWQQLYDAFEFSKHLCEVQKILDRHYASVNPIESIASISETHVFGLRKTRNYIIPHLSQLLNKQGVRSLWKKSKEATTEPDKLVLHRPKQSLLKENEQSLVNGKDKPKRSAEIIELEKIIVNFVRSESHVESNYGRDLARSINAFIHLDKHNKTEAHANVSLDDDISNAREVVHQHYTQIFDLSSLEDFRYDWLVQANLWPSLSPISILEQLRSNTYKSLDSDVKHELIDYAMAILKLQHLNRMKDAVVKNDETRLRQEQNNPGHTNWDPNNYPDWLLLEIDANIQIRDDQVTVALEMISPNSGFNSVLQMNMGQGKTSMIMPMVACVLADRNMLARLLVPNALLSQTAQTLQSRLGGLVGREITHIPFSRRTPTTSEHVKEYQTLHREMLNTGGIILGIPEHVLSFKLSGLQQLSDGKMPDARRMVDVQRWMDKVSRDILDECDFTLATKTQLVYPSGAQLTVDGHPHRWKTAQAILALVAHHLCDLARKFPRSIDVIERGISLFPIAHILRDDVEHAIIQNIVDEICAGRTPILSIHGYKMNEQNAIREFISQEEVTKSTMKVIDRLFANAPTTIKNVYLLRGLLVHGILLLCLKKRWNVQYGLHPKRDPVAVPFHAKGVPSEQAEWGHPDVAILFTCLAFYYQGLELKQLRQSLQVVLKSDDPATEYDQWTQTSTTLPDALRHWNIINLDDEGQITQIWTHLRFSIVVVNHFLNYFVFPAHAKQFSIKLQASGWDVPLFSLNERPSISNEKRPGITTGFSGTNDNRRLLPLTVEQQDLPGLLHTNAEVLTYLLQRRNREYVLAMNENGRRFSEIDLLRHLKWKKIQILIDAGAFILEMDNLTLVTEWQKIDYEAKAAVYFGNDNKAWVRYREGGKIIPLLATPLADNLEGCLVYLDEAHTRGTDLKLPELARGALTLGLNQTKDHTVQAAMRLRQLGTTQSITYIAPPEVHQSIRDVCMKVPNDYLDSSDVIKWLLHQTCKNIEELQPLYFSQGKDFCNRTQAAISYEKFLTNPSHRKEFMSVLQQPEKQDLEQLYAPKMEATAQLTPSDDSMHLTGELSNFQEELKRRQLGSRDIRKSLKTSAFEEVEQEREVAFQIEEEREVQRPRRMHALRFPGLHRTIRDFVTTGILSGEDGYRKASVALEMTNIFTKYPINTTKLLTSLEVSTEFLRTVRTKKGAFLDNYTRPVNWVLWSEVSQVALVIIPEEAELVIPILRTIKTPRVNLLLYAAPVTRKMLRFDRLKFYGFPMLPAAWKAPDWLRFELGILAGRLYFNYSDYRALVEKLHGAEQGEDYDFSSTVIDQQSSAKNVLAFLNEWLSLRRQGQDITHTPMGYLCHGRQLRSDHPFFIQRTVEQSANTSNAFREEYESQADDYLESDGGEENSMDKGKEYMNYIEDDFESESGVDTE